MILKERLQILDEVLKSAQEVLKQYSSIAEVASKVLSKSEVYMSSDTVDPKEVLDMFRRVHDMQIQSLNTFNAILEKFPTEHTIQELQLLEIFRNLTERQKQQLMSTIETLVLQKRQR